MNTLLFPRHLASGLLPSRLDGRRHMHVMTPERQALMAEVWTVLTTSRDLGDVATQRSHVASSKCI